LYGWGSKNSVNLQDFILRKKKEMQGRETKGGKERLNKNAIVLYLARQDLSWFII
jgi:hypothetical protein